MEMKEWSKITVQRVRTYNKCTLHVHHSHDTTTDMISMLNKSLGVICNWNMSEGGS